MIIINEQETGLGKSFLKKIRLKDVSLKNAVKVTKFAAPIAAGFIPVGGGVASKLLSSKGGKLVNRVAKSKAVRKGVALSKTKLGRKVVSAVQNQPRAEIEPVNAITAASFATALPAEQSQSSYSESSESVLADSQPVGELTPVKAVSSAKMATVEQIQPVTPAKNNTMLYVLGAVVLGGGIYFATKNN
ncbi:hypothetical protein BC749_108161 [Flavobacterium araucananum]|uniref:Uncharacterized protein n=1 Tax=Flavobacterium araucananum TaxID=946678 RepID=A0A227NQM3_9FLAO|nr:hypothetical protein [Flavobacterium araucananum]OXG00007.1 hypothetical protein B0A64_20830 [Flavobacterium araucananum]PWJ97011.1 hypothetical protein BC749_108161 [Flavobacterium araucananum]